MSNNLNLSQVAAAQNQKEVTINDQAGELDAALTASLSVLVDDSNAATLTAEQLRRNFFFVIAEDTTPPDDAITITVPGSIPRGLIKVLNETSQSVTAQISGQPAATPTIAAGQGALLSCDGTNLRAGDGGNGDQPYDFGFLKAEAPASDEVIGKVVVPRAIMLPADLAGAAGHVDTNPTASFDIDVTDGGSSIGTISIASDGTFTFTTVDNTAKAIAAGSVVRFVAPASTDATVAGIAVTLIGSLT